ncbi:unnamed protein product, partial [Prorocentrum cordatum]
MPKASINASVPPDLQTARGRIITLRHHRAFASGERAPPLIHTEFPASLLVAALIYSHVGIHRSTVARAAPRGSSPRGKNAHVRARPPAPSAPLFGGRRRARTRQFGVKTAAAATWRAGAGGSALQASSKARASSALSACRYWLAILRRRAGHPGERARPPRCRRLAGARRAHGGTPGRGGPGRREHGGRPGDHGAEGAARHGGRRQRGPQASLEGRRRRRRRGRPRRPRHGSDVGGSGSSRGPRRGVERGAPTGPNAGGCSHCASTRYPS